MPKKADKKTAIVKKYIKLRKKLGRTIKAADLEEVDVTKDMVKHHFNSLSALEDIARTADPTAFPDVKILDIYSKSRVASLKKIASSSKRFVITTAVAGCDVDIDFLASIKNYCKRNKAELLVLMAADPAHNRDVEHWSISKELENEHIVFHDTSLNSNIFISSIKLSAKHIDPITGLDRIGQRAGSFILASPKQRLQLVATSNEKLPHALMTTGAITGPNYNSVYYMSDRTAYIADNDHIMGALIVEIVDDVRYHYRQVQSGKDGSLIDLGKKYSPDGSVGVAETAAFVLGDWHSGSTDQQVIAATIQMAKMLKPKNIVLHDAFDGLCINHHEDHNLALRAVRAMQNQSSLAQELAGLAKDLDMLSGYADRLVIVKSNHDEFLSSHYLAKGKYVDDPQNHRIALDLAAAMIDGQDPLRYGVERAGLNNKNKITWLQRDDDFTIAGIQLGAHGDKGPNGSMGSLRGMEKAYSKSVTGHSHTPGILRGAWAVGTSSHLKLTYNQGPSSWLQTHCIVYADGSRQLINIIDGQWRLEAA